MSSAVRKPRLPGWTEFGAVGNRTYRAWGKYRITELFSETSLRNGLLLCRFRQYGSNLFNDTIRTTTDLIGGKALDWVINGSRMEIVITERFRLNFSSSKKHI